MKFKESTLRLYAKPLSDSEDIKCKRTIEAIRDALLDLGYKPDKTDVEPLEKDTYAYSVSMNKTLSSDRITIFIQGSYANNTCVRGESDVDIAVVNENNFQYAFGEHFNGSATMEREIADKLKDNVESVLKKHFPYCVHRKNKSIKVDGNSYRKQADTVPCLSIHYYYRSHLNDYGSFKDGIVIYADDGEVIYNFPKQHIANGRVKNTNTNHYYKKMVRIIKKIRGIMSDFGYSCADKVSSFGLESLLWNIPDVEYFKYVTYKYEFSHIIDYLYNNLNLLHQYKEANGIKDLCADKASIDNYSQFIKTLRSFYEYDIHE